MSMSMSVNAKHSERPERLRFSMLASYLYISVHQRQLHAPSADTPTESGPRISHTRARHITPNRNRLNREALARCRR
jgi:hypothetical protein